MHYEVGCYIRFHKKLTVNFFSQKKHLLTGAIYSQHSFKTSALFN